MKNRNLLLALSFLLSTNFSYASEPSYQYLKEMFQGSQAPASLNEIKEFLNSSVLCLGLNNKNSVSQDTLVIENVLTQKQLGPAFPEKRVEAILMGSSPDKNILGFQYSSSLSSRGLELTTVRTSYDEECMDFYDYYTGADLGIQCWKEPDQKQINLLVRQAESFLTYQDITNDIYGYCYRL